MKRSFESIIDVPPALGAVVPVRAKMAKSLLKKMIFGRKRATAGLSSSVFRANRGTAGQAGSGTRLNQQAAISPPRVLGSYRYVRLRWRLLFAVIDAFGWTLMRAFGWMGRGRRQRRDAAAVRRILLVQLDHLGDAVITLAMLKELRALFPWATIDVLASKANQELFNAVDEVDAVYASCVNRLARDRTRWFWLPATIQWGWRLRRRRYDVAIDVRGEFPVALSMWLAAAKRRVGFSAGGGGFLLTHRAAFVRNRPEVESRFALLDVLQDDVNSRTTADPCIGRRRWKRSFYPQPEASRRVAEVRSSLLPVHHDARPLIAVHVGAAMPAKRWPVEHWSALVRQLGEEFDAVVALVGDQYDSRAAREIIAGTDGRRVLDLTGRFSIGELGAFLETADLFVGADSGPAHLAAAVGTPSVVVFSGTNNVNQWRPFGTHVRAVRHAVTCSPCHRTVCPYRDHACMRYLYPETVMQAIRHLGFERSIDDDAAQPDADALVPVPDTRGQRIQEPEGMPT